MTNEDFYSLLGVSKNATQDELKRAYRQLARRLHPDANQGDPEAEERFKEVTLAYEVLSNPETRRRYDMFGLEGVRGTGAAGTGGGGGEQFFNVGDIFEAFFGQGSPFSGGFGRSAGQRVSRKGADAQVRVSLDFEQAVFGATREISLKLPVTCERCSGSGASEGSSPEVCRVCQGSGEQRRVRQSIFGQMVTASPCGQCGGSGELITSPCDDCRGEGRVTRERSFNVEVPAGVDDGATLRLSGRGPAGFRGGPDGDLYVHLSVAPDSRFTRQGYDLVRILQVPMTQAAIGTRMTLETLDGEESLEIPPGTQTGRVFKLRGKGVPHLGGRGRGDLIVSVQVETPTKLTGEQEELLRRLAESRGEEITPLEEGSIRSKIRSAFR